jgi:glycerol-3-phosphate dehydrogenase
MFDVVVVGAGINGAAVAREAALCGVRVLLLDRGDIGGGTSSASSRLIHGGLRYLEHAELGLVRESLLERERLLACAPHLVQPIELYIPVYRGARRKSWQIAIGLQLYDWLSRGKSLPVHRRLSALMLAQRLPGLRQADLVGGASYFDAQVTFPERLVVEIVRDAVAAGATLATHSRVTRIRVERGAVVGVDWCDRAGAVASAAAAVVVNAAGPWVDQVLDGLTERRLIGGTKGSHLIVEPFPGAPSGGVYVEASADGRPLFILPWNGLYLIGTTDERFDGDPGDAAIDDAEFAYLVAETERVFPGAAPLAARVLYTHSGVRPLPHQPRAAAGAITRRHIVRAHRGARGLYSIVGGKLTTHRALAEDVLRALRAQLPELPRRSPTRDRPLPGALRGADHERLRATLAERFGIDQARRLSSTYGAAAQAIAALANDRELAACVAEAGPTLVAELVYALQSEWAVTLVDILQRRCMAGLDADFGLRTAPAACAALCRLGIWDSTRAAEELASYREYAARCRARALASAER